MRWDDFESNISTAFKDVSEGKDFFDVTLTCGDEQIQAHKVILSACSPFFRTVLRNNRHEHPLLYLKGVTYNDIVSVLDFMYHGQVGVAQEDLNSFLAVAEELKVKGLTQTTSDANLKTNQPRPKEQARRQDIQPQTKRRGGSPVPQVVRKSNFNPERFDNENEIEEVVPIKSEPGCVALPIERASMDDVDTRSGVVADPNTDNSAYDDPVERLAIMRKVRENLVQATMDRRVVLEKLQDVELDQSGQRRSKRLQEKPRKRYNNY